MKLQKIDTIAATHLCRELFAKYGLDAWQLKFGRGTKIMGNCSYRNKTITLSVWQPGGCFLDTLFHEVAHALTPGSKHGMAWKLKCIELGAVPEACCRISGGDHMPNELRRYRVYCTKCNKTTSASTHPRRNYVDRVSRCCSANLNQEKLICT